MDITNYIESELYIIVPVLYVIGMVLKNSKIIDNRWIPIVLGCLGVILACVYKITTYSPENIGEILSLLYAGSTQGVLCAAGSVYVNNIFKQIKKGNENESNSENDSENR